MTEQELTQILARKGDPGRENAALVMHPQIVRNAARLKKKRRDRQALMLMLVLAALFLLLGVGTALAVSSEEQALTEPLKHIALGGAGLTFLFAPLLAWKMEREERETE